MCYFKFVSFDKNEHNVKNLNVFIPHYIQKKIFWLCIPSSVFTSTRPSSCVRPPFNRNSIIDFEASCFAKDNTLDISRMIII